jgi:hypothetical protein
MPRGQSFHFSTGGGGAGFNFSNPESIFSEFLRGGGAGMGGDDDDFGSFGSFGMGGMPGGMGGSRSSRRGPGGSRFDGGRRAPTPEVTVVEKPLQVSLEEMFKGTTKKMKIKRKTYDQATGKQSTQDRILEVPIKAGLKAGSKIKFSDVGDQVEGGTQDLHFIVSEVCFSHPSILNCMYRQHDRNPTQCSLAKATTFVTQSNSISKKPSQAGDERSRQSTASNFKSAAAAPRAPTTPTASPTSACPRARNLPNEETSSSVSR